MTRLGRMSGPFEEPDPIYGGYVEDDFLRLSNPAGVEAAWRKVQQALPDRWTVAGVMRIGGPTKWRAEASGPGRASLSGHGHDPESALLDLVDRAREFAADQWHRRPR